MKKIVFLISTLFLCATSYAQFFGGPDDGSTRSTLIGSQLNGSIESFTVLYQGSFGDGFDADRIQTLLSAQNLTLYEGGRGDGFAVNRTTSTNTGVEFAILYSGASGDGWAKAFETALLDGGGIDQIFMGGSGDGFDRSLLVNAFIDGFLADLYVGGIGDGHSTQISTDNLLSGLMVLIFNGGDSDGHATQLSSSNILSGLMLALYCGGNGDGYASNLLNTSFGNNPPTAICQDANLFLDITSQALLTPSDVNNGSNDDGGVVFLAFETMSFDGETTVTSPTDELLVGTAFPYAPTAFTVPVTGDYTFSMTGNTPSGQSVIFIWDDTPVPNSGDFSTRPEFFALMGWDNDGTFTFGDPISSPTITLSAGKTYYSSSLDNGTGLGTFTTTVDLPIRSTAAVVKFTCVDVGVNPTDLYVFDQSGKVSSCSGDISVSDSIAPVIVCPLNQTQSSALYTVPDYWANGEATATDNCTTPVTITSQDPAAGTQLVDGEYTVTITAEDQFGNVNSCTFELKVDATLGVDDIELGSIKMYPNPAADIVYLSNPRSLILKQAEIYDINGRLIVSHDLLNMGTEKTIDVSQLSSASYIVLIKGEQGQITKRLIIE